VTVDSNGGDDGIDTLRNIERAQFSDSTLTIALPAAPTITSVVPGNASATVNFTAPATAGVTSLTLFVRSGTTTVQAITGIAPTATSRLVTGLTNGTTYSFTLAAVNAFGAGPESPATTATPVAPIATAPVVSARTPAVNATNVVTNTNVTATFSLNVAGVTGTTFTLRRVSNNTLVAAGVTYNATTRTATLNPNANLVAGVQYRATLTGGAAAIRVAPNGTPLTTTSWTFTTDGTAPTVFTGAGTLTNPLAGATGFSRTANVVTEFSEPMVLGGITATTVRLQRVSTGAIVTAVVTSANLNGRTRAILNPGVTLVANAQYRVLLTGGATALRDLSGNPLATQNRTFTTGA
jgi:hypothetical protein